jgi:hypothetical protein
MKMSALIARLKIVLDDVEPVVMRRMEVPAGLRLDRLHHVIQAAFGWTDSHLHEFRIKGIGFGIPNPDWDYGDDLVDARKTTLIEAVEDTGAKSFKYLYDFGDGWEHSVRIERIQAAEEGLLYPRLLEASGRCPPEDIGGPWGYESFLEAINDPDHEGHEDARQWLGEDSFDPNFVTPDKIEAALSSLAHRLSRKPRKRV